MVNNSFRLNRGVRFGLTLVLTLNLVLGTTLMALAAPIPDSESDTLSRAPSANDVISPFPILDPFIYTEAPNFIFGGPPSKPAAYLTAGVDDPDGEGWLRLTNNDNQQGGYALYNKAFPSDSGIAVRFQYASYGGTGADGIAFFLLDGVVDRPVISEHLGGTLGYSDYGQYTPADKYGLTKGYVGIGFDEFGNYSTPSHGGPPSAPGFRPQSVTLRGSGDGYVGYNYLTHVQLTGGKTIDDAPRDDPRIVEITIIDEIINVKIDFGTGFETIIENYDLSTAPGQAEIPETFKLGFGGSTGGSTNYHEIRTLAVKIPADMSIDVTDNMTTTVPGAPIEYVIVVSNNEYNDVVGATVVDELPSSINGVSWSCEAATGARCYDSKGLGNSIDTKVDLKANTAVTFTVKGMVVAHPNVRLINSAEVFPPADMFDVNEYNDKDTDETNMAPWLNGDEFIVDEESTNTLDVLANDEDIDVDPLSIVKVGIPDKGGTVSIDGDDLTYTPAGDFTGSETFTYTVSDGNGGVNTGSIVVTVNNINDAPEAVDDVATVQKNILSSSLQVLGNDTDPDGDTLRIVAVGTPSSGVAANRETSIAYAPEKDFTGIVTFDYTVSDGFLTDIAHVTLTVKAAPNQPPVGGDDVAITEEEVPVTIFVLANDTDPDGDTLSIDGFTTQFRGTPPTSGTLSINEYSLTYTPEKDFAGVDSFTYALSDGKADTPVFATVVVTVTEVNDPPMVGNDYGVIVEEDTPTDIPVLDNDGDIEGDDLVIIEVTPPTNGTVEIDEDGGSIIYIPYPNFNGEDEFTYIVTDGEDKESGNVHIRVTPKPDAPRPQDDSARTAYGQPRMIQVLGNDTDPDGDTLSLLEVGTAITGTAAQLGDRVIYTPTAAVTTTFMDVFTYTVTDGALTGTATVRVTVSENPNHKPIALDDIVATSEDKPLTINVLGNDSDPEGDPLTIKAVGGAGTTISGTLGIQGGKVVYTPTINIHGSGRFTYTVTDGGRDATATVYVLVTRVNDLPVAVDDMASTMEETPVTIPVLNNDIDPDNDRGNLMQTVQLATDVFKVVDMTSPPNGHVETDGQNIIYTPYRNFYGTDVFTYTINDGSQGGNDMAKVSVTVTNTNDNPYAGLYVNLVFAQDEIITLTDIITWAVDDPDCFWDFDWITFESVLVCPDADQHSVIGIGQGRHGTAQLIDNNVVTYVPGPFFTLLKGDVLTYTINDGKGGVDTDMIILLGYDYSILLPFIFKDSPL